MLEQTPLWQTKNWQTFQNSLGFEAFFVKDDQEKVLIICKKLLFGKSFFDIQRGKISKNLWQKINQQAQEKNAIFCRIALNDNLIPDFLIKQVRFTNAYRFPALTRVLDLQSSLDDILAQMNATGRRHLRIAQKNNLQIERSNDVALFFNILNKTTTRQKFHAHALSYYQKLLTAFGEKAFLLLVKKDEQILSGGIFIFTNQVCTYLYGASSDENRKLQAPSLMQWQAITIAKEAGKKYFDFLGIAPEDDKDHPWQSVSQFKKKFGGFTVDYAFEFEVPFNKFWYHAFNFAQKIRKIGK